MKLRSSPKLGNCGSGGECARPALALPRPDAELPQAAMLGPLCSGDDSPDVPEKPRSASSGSGLAGDSGGVCACTGRCGALCADVSMCASRVTCANATSAPCQHNAENHSLPAPTGSLGIAVAVDRVRLLLRTSREKLTSGAQEVSFLATACNGAAVILGRLENHTGTACARTCDSMP